MVPQDGIFCAVVIFESSNLLLQLLLAVVENDFAELDARAEALRQQGEQSFERRAAAYAKAENSTRWVQFMDTSTIPVTQLWPSEQSLIAFV